MDSKIISEPSGNVLHNTYLTCHASPVCDENSSLIYSVLERCGQAFPSQNNVLKGTVCLLTVGSAASTGAVVSPGGTAKKDPARQRMLSGVPSGRRVAQKYPHSGSFSTLSCETSFRGLGRSCAAQGWKVEIPTLVGGLCSCWEEPEPVGGVGWKAKKTWRGWLCHLSQARTQKTDGVGFRHGVFATSGVNFYERVPPGPEIAAKT